MWLLALLACHGPSETGSGGMVGHVLDADGKPLEGVVVQSVEAEYRTDAEGHFAVAWKPPGTHVFFERGGTTWHRTWQPESDPAEVELQLPPTREVDVDCASIDATCTLKWDLGGGFSARATIACDPDATRSLEAVPQGAPAPECRSAGQPVEAAVSDGGDTLTLHPPSQPLRVEVRSVEGAAPEACVVFVDQTEASPAGEGFWVADQAGEAVVRVACDGRDAWPVVAEPGRGSIAVEWSQSGPEIDLEGRFPAASVLRLRPLAAKHWLEVEPVSDGIFPLPPVPAGIYAAAVVVDGRPSEAPAPEAGRPGTLELMPAASGGAFGGLRLEGDAVSGRIPVAIAEADGG